MGDREKIAATLDEQLHTLDRHAIPTTHTQQVYCLARAVFAREFGEDEAIRQAQRLAVSPFDTFCLQIVHELQAASALVADGKGADVDGGVRMAIPNSSCTGGGRAVACIGSPLRTRLSQRRPPTMRALRGGRESTSLWGILLAI